MHDVEQKRYKNHSVIIHTQQLGKRYGRRWAVRDLDLEVAEGDIFGFLGPNGAGKSTTIRMMLGLVRPTHGRVEVFNCDVHRQREKALAQVGAVVEAPAFYDHLTAWKNLDLFSRMSGKVNPRRIAEVLDFVGLSGRERDPVRVFSHGMRVRLGIAQSLLPTPRAVILDEPTDGLDPAGVLEIRELILRLRHDLNLTVFLSSHMLGEVEHLCNRIGIVNEGRLLYQGLVEDIVATPLPEWEVAVDAPGPARRVIQGFGFEISADGSAGTLLVRMQSDQVPTLNEALVQSGVKVYRLHRRRRTLEDAFLELTRARI
jgi:ABC-2 type transport system ATP-binding protein